MTFFIGLCMIFFINQMGEENFISENALTAQLISSSNDELINNEVKHIQKIIRKDDIFSFIEKYFDNYQMSSNRQYFSFEENGKKNEGF